MIPDCEAIGEVLHHLKAFQQSTADTDTTLFIRDNRETLISLQRQQGGRIDRLRDTLAG